jgi:hypothetical protein
MESSIPSGKKRKEPKIHGSLNEMEKSFSKREKKHKTMNT